MSQIVQVVSMEEVPMRLVISGFQSKEVRGAEKSLSYNKVICTFLRLRSKLTSLLSLILQILRHSPEVAIKSGLSPFWVFAVLPHQGWTWVLLAGTHVRRRSSYQGVCLRWAARFPPVLRKDYLIVDIWKEGPDGESEGVLWLVRKAQWKNVPRSSVGDNLVFDIITIICFRLQLGIHHHQNYIKCVNRHTF